MNLDNLKQNFDILIVTDQLPYPPRNGITLPVYNYAIGLMETRRVKIILLADYTNPPTPDAIAKNESIFGPVLVVYLTRRGKLIRMAREIAHVEMYQHGWVLAEKSFDIGSLQAETCVVSPMSAVAKWRATGLDNMVNCRLSIAAVNDCTTAEYFFREEQSFGGVQSIITGMMHRLRSLQIAKIEAKLLAPYRHILLQTNKDQHLMGQLVSKETASRVVVVPNGVRADYFDLSPSPKNGSILFVAELSGEYSSIAKWLVDELWPEVLKKHPECQLVIVGKGASDKLSNTLRSAKNIKHMEFVDDLAQLYREAMIVLSPIFKGYGLINKTLEAMAMSVPVVGGMAAFNGIRGFQAGLHGEVCKTKSTAEFVVAITQLISDPVRRIAIGDAGRKLLQEQFRWEFAVDKIERLITASNPN